MEDRSLYRRTVRTDMSKVGIFLIKVLEDESLQQRNQAAFLVTSMGENGFGGNVSDTHTCIFSNFSKMAKFYC